MGSSIAWLARAGTALGQCALVGWLAAISWSVLEAWVWPEPRSVVFLAGAYGLALWLGAAIVLIPCSFLIARSGDPTARFDRAWLLLGAESTALALAAWPLYQAVRAALPSEARLPAELATVATGYLGWGAISLAAWFAWRHWAPGREFPFWTLAPLYLAMRVVTADPVERALPGREHFVAGGSLAVRCLCAFGSAQRLPRRWLALLTSRGRSACCCCSSASWLDPHSARCSRSSIQPHCPWSRRSALSWTSTAMASRPGSGQRLRRLRSEVSPYALEIVDNGTDDNCAGGDLASAAPELQARRAPGAARRSLVLITTDTVRADMLNGRNMPQLAHFAERGAQFTQTYAAAPYTTDSIRAMMTGHWVMSMTSASGAELGAEPTLADRLRESGYETSLVMHRWWDEAGDWTSFQGFDRVDQAAADKHDAYRDVTGPQVTEHALGELARLSAGGRPFFLWIHSGTRSGTRSVESSQAIVAGVAPASLRSASSRWSSMR